MTGSDQTGHALTLRDYLHVVRRQKWIIVLAVVLVPAAAIAFSLQEKPVYSATAHVLLGSPAVSPTNGSSQTPSSSGSDDAQTQASFARSPQIARRAIETLGIADRTPQQLLDESSVSAETNANVLDFTVHDRDASLAAKLARGYAVAYGSFRRSLDTRAFEAAYQRLAKRIASLGTTHGTLYATLVARQQSVRTEEALQTANTYLISSPSTGAKISPKPTRNGILGLVLGLVLGLGLAFLRESLDTRVRTAEEIGNRLHGAPLLGRVAAPPKKLADAQHLVMLDQPASVQAEAFRMLRTNLDFVNLERDARTLMLTSAVQREGKTTTVANLALALARAGKRVALVDLDLRRPMLARFFGLEGPGLTQVVLGHVPLEQALASIAIAEPGSASGSAANGNGNGNGHRAVRGVLEVLPAGPIPPDPGEFVGTRALSEVLEALRERADFVLLDTPPVLQVGDALALSSKVDGILVATRLKVVRRNTLHELARQLATVPTPVLGYVVTDAGEEGGYGYGYGYGYDYEPRPYEPVERPGSGSAVT